jgi:glycosyltransferase involved in cell wall biosynthesis
MAAGQNSPDSSRLAPYDEGVTVSAIMPCLNEAETIGTCCAKVFAAFTKLGVIGEVIVGDNGSTDQSVKIAESFGARVVHEPRRGYGAAIAAAASAARGRYLIIADADDSYDWSNIGPFISRLQEGHELVMGNRFAGTIHRGAMPPLHRYLGNPILSWISRKAYQIPIHDFHCGMRAITRAGWERLRTETTGMEFATEMIVRAAAERLRISEIPVDLYPDKRSRPPHLRSFRDGWRHLRFIMTYAPNYLYLGPATALVLVGALIQILLASGPKALGSSYFGPHFLALGLLLYMSGLSIGTLGIIAKVHLVNNSKVTNDRVVDWLRKYFSLERGLVISASIAVPGLTIDLALLLDWFIHRGPMEQSVHTAFVATGMLASGVQLAFASFLLQLLLTSSSLRNSRVD